MLGSNEHTYINMLFIILLFKLILVDYNKKHSLFFVLVFLKSTMEVWTSGTNDGIGCLRKYGWCPSGQFFIPDLKFGSGEGYSNAVNENGILLYYTSGPASKSYLKDISTSARYNYICEVKKMRSRLI